MAIRVVRLGSPRAASEGLRIGTVRRPPRGVPKGEYAARDLYDVWLPNLAPSEALLRDARRLADERSWRSFARRYRAEMNGNRLVLYVGYSHPVTFEPDGGISFAVEERGRKVTVSGIDKEYVGEIAARIRKQRPPEPYKGKGIRYENEVVRRKAGKTGKV